MDSRGAAVLQGLEPTTAAKAKKLYDLAAAAGEPIMLVSGFRSLKEQQKIYNQGRTTPGAIVSNAPPGYSWHNYGMAFDIVPVAGYGISPARWEKVGKIGESLGLVWGGRWKSFPDRPHFQNATGSPKPGQVQTALNWPLIIIAGAVIFLSLKKIKQWIG